MSDRLKISHVATQSFSVATALHTDFALRVLIQAGLNEGNLTTINDIEQVIYCRLQLTAAIATERLMLDAMTHRAP